MAEIVNISDRLNQTKSELSGVRERLKSARLEDDMKEIKGDLKTLLRDVAEIKGSIGKFATAEAVANIKGRVDSLPTLATLSTLAAIVLALFALMPQIRALIAHWLT